MIGTEEKSRVTSQAKSSGQGEGFLQLLLAKFAILHKVAGSNDIGIDYFCEWINKNESSNVLFAVQLKTRQEQNVKIKKANNNARLNKLDQYSINGLKAGNQEQNEDGIKNKTIEYWKAFEIPVYLFVAVLGDEFQLFYKRYTPILHGTTKDSVEHFHRVNDGNKFLAFIDNQSGGFCRDLFMDYVRCNYKKGSLVYKSPENDFGLKQFSEQEYYIDLLKKEIYLNAFKETFRKIIDIPVLGQQVDSALEEQCSFVHEAWQNNLEAAAEMGMGSKIGNKMSNPSNYSHLKIIANDPVTEEIITKDKDFGNKVAEIYNSFLCLISHVRNAREKKGVYVNEITNFVLSFVMKYEGISAKQMANIVANAILDTIGKKNNHNAKD